MADTIYGPYTIEDDCGINAAQPYNSVKVRNIWYANGRWWVGYADTDDYIVYNSTTDYTSWGTHTDIIDNGVNRNYKSIFNHPGGTEVYFCRSNTSNSDVYFRRGVCGSDGVITWDTQQQLDAGVSVEQLPFACKGSDGYPWFVWNYWYSSSFWEVKICKATSTTGSTWGTPWDASVIEDSIQDYTPTMFPLESDYVMAVFFDVTAAQGSRDVKARRIYSSGTMDSVVELWSNSMYFGTWGEGNGEDGFVVAHIYTGSQYDFKLKKWTGGETNSWGSEETVAANIGNTTGTSWSICCDENGNCWVFWTLGDGQYIYYRKRNASGTWEDAATLYNAGSDIDIRNVVATSTVYTIGADKYIGLVFDITDSTVTDLNGIFIKLEAAVSTESITKYSDARFLKTETITKYSDTKILLDTGIRTMYDMSSTDSGNLDDLSGWDNDGTGYGSIAFGGVAGPSGQCGNATDFDGVDDYVDIGNDATITQFSDISIAFWINPDVLPATPISCDAYSITITDGGQVKIKLNLEAEYTKTFGDLGDVQTGTWTHVAFTFDGTNWTVYINGSGKTPQVQSGTIQNATDHVFLGREG